MGPRDFKFVPGLYTIGKHRCSSSRIRSLNLTPLPCLGAFRPMVSDGSGKAGTKHTPLAGCSGAYQHWIVNPLHARNLLYREHLCTCFARALSDGSAPETIPLFTGSPASRAGHQPPPRWALPPPRLGQWQGSHLCTRALARPPCEMQRRSSYSTHTPRERTRRGYSHIHHCKE